MALVAITRSPGPELARCVLTHLERRPIDVSRALAQHRAYQDTLRGTGIEVVELPSDPSLPDGVFVETPRWFSTNWPSSPGCPLPRGARSGPRSLLPYVPAVP